VPVRQLVAIRVTVDPIGKEAMAVSIKLRVAKLVLMLLR
jgi:hypothetical protein